MVRAFEVSVQRTITPYRSTETDSPDSFRNTSLMLSDSSQTPLHVEARQKKSGSARPRCNELLFKKRWAAQSNTLKLQNQVVHLYLHLHYLPRVEQAQNQSRAHLQGPRFNPSSSSGEQTETPHSSVPIHRQNRCDLVALRIPLGSPFGGPDLSYRFCMSICFALLC
jgi:hypothetical protein